MRFTAPGNTSDPEITAQDRDRSTEDGATQTPKIEEEKKEDEIKEEKEDKIEEEEKFLWFVNL